MKSFDVLLSESSELKKLYDKSINAKDIHEKTLILLNARRLIIDGIQNGNFYNYDDANTIADKFNLQRENWSRFGCSEFNMR